jgi:xanthine/uracil permease
LTFIKNKEKGLRNPEREEKSNLNKWMSAPFWLAGIQWLFYLFANTVVIPLSVGAAFGLSPDTIASVVNTTFIVTGAASLLQASFGHRFALMEGPAGLWWGFMLSLAASAPAMGMTLPEIGGALSLGIIAAGIAQGLLTALHFGELLKKAFTPIVMFVYLFLLAAQLVMTFFKSMTGYDALGRIDLPVTALSAAIALLVALIGMKGRGTLGNFSILIGMACGWIAYRLLFPGETDMAAEATGSLLPMLFPLGPPRFEFGVFAAAIMAGLINMTNTIAAIGQADQLYGTKSPKKHYSRSFYLTSLYTSVSGLLGLVPYGPYSSSIGFLECTRVLDRSALILGGALFMTLGFIPALGAFFASMPVSVGGAVLFVVYFQLFGSAFRGLKGYTFNSKTIYRIAAPSLLGLCILNLPADAFLDFPGYVRPVIGNGLLMGVTLAMVLEAAIDWPKYDQPDKQAGVK